MPLSAHLRRWLPSAALLLALFLLETVVLPRMSPLLPCLLPLFVGILGVLEGPVPGAAFGLGAGLLFALTSPGLEASLLLPLSLAGAGAGLLPRPRHGSPFPACLLGGLGALIVLDGFRSLSLALLGGAAVPGLLALTGLELLLSLPCLPLVYALIRLAGAHPGPAACRRSQKGVPHG